MYVYICFLSVYNFIKRTFWEILISNLFLICNIFLLVCWPFHKEPFCIKMITFSLRDSRTLHVILDRIFPLVTGLGTVFSTVGTAMMGEPCSRPLPTQVRTRYTEEDKRLYVQRGSNPRSQFPKDRDPSLRQQDHQDRLDRIFAKTSLARHRLARKRRCQIQGVPKEV